jgi:hypothetical protein
LKILACFELRISNFEIQRKLFRVLQIVFELLTPFFQSLQSQLPAVKLDAQLINVTGHLGPLRIVFFQLTPELGDTIVRLIVSPRANGWDGWHQGRFSASLTRESHSRRRRIHHQRRAAMSAGEGDVRCR